MSDISDIAFDSRLVKPGFCVWTNSGHSLRVIYQTSQLSKLGSQMVNMFVFIMRYIIEQRFASLTGQVKKITEINQL